jgi:hypothetical protein
MQKSCGRRGHMLALSCVTEQIHPMSIDYYRGISEGRIAAYALMIVTVISMITVFAVLSH